MARLWSCGFELNSLTAGVEVTGVSGSPTISSTTYRSGAYALEISSLSSGTPKYSSYQFLSAEGTSSRYYRYYLRVATPPSAENRIAVWNDAQGVATPGVYMTIDNSYVLKLYDEDGQITGTATLTQNKWHRIEVRIDTTGGAGAQVVEAKVDGAAAFASSSTRSIASNNQPFHWLLGGNLNSEAQTTGQWFFDDLAINDATGSFQNGYPGAGSIKHLRPNAAGDASDWTNDYTYVYEVTPDDGTTLVSSNTLNQVDDHNIDASGLSGSATVNCVQVGARYNGVGASANASFVLRIRESSGSTPEESSAIAPANTTYTTNANAAPKNYPLTLYDLPGASTSAWTATTLDSAQIGYRLSATSTNAARISTVWLLVDYVDTTGILSGTSAGTVTVSGALTGTGALAGTSAGTCVLSGALSGLVFASGTSAGTCVASGTLNGFGSLSGTSAGIAIQTGALLGSGALSGSSSGTVTLAGTLLGAGALSGSSSGATSQTGNLTADYLELQKRTSGGAWGALRNFGLSVVEYDDTGPFTNGILYEYQIRSWTSGSASDWSNTAGVTYSLGGISGSVAGTGTASGTLTGAGALAGSSSGAGTPAGILTGAGVLSGSSSGTGTPAGVLTGTGALAGSSVCQTTTYEDWTTWDENDPFGRLTVATNQITGLGVGTNGECVDKNYGSNYFSGEFTHYIDFKTDSSVSNALIGIWAISNIDDWTYADLSSGGICLYHYPPDSSFYLEKNGTYYEFGSPQLGVRYYIKIVRYSSGNVVVSVYSDANHTILLWQSGEFSYTEESAYLSVAWNDYYDEWSGSLYNLDIGLGFITVSGTLTGVGALSGSSSGAGTASGTLTGTGALSGSSSGQTVQSGLLQGLAALEGSSAGTSIASGAILGIGLLSGDISCVATVSGTIFGEGVLSGLSSGTSEVSASLLGVGALAGSSAGTVLVSGTLLGDGALVGSSSGTVTVSGFLWGGTGLYGTASGTVVVSGTLLGDGVLSGSSAGTCVVTGLVSGETPIYGDIYGTSTASATLSGTGLLEGETSGNATCSGLLLGEGALLGLSEGTSLVSGDLSGIGELYGDVTCISTVSGTLLGSGALFGSIAGTSFAQAMSGASGILNGDCAGTSICSATITGYGPLTGEVSTSSLVSGVLTGTGFVSGVSEGFSYSSGTLIGTGELVGLSAGIAAVSGSLTGYSYLSGSCLGVSIASAALLGSGALVGAAISTSLVAGDLEAWYSGFAAGTSIVSATLLGQGWLEGACVGSCSISGVIVGILPLVVGDVAGSDTAYMDVVGSDYQYATVVGSDQLYGNVVVGDGYG